MTLDLLATSTPRFARVVLPIPVDQPFTYQIPDALMGRVFVGCRVDVPFGKRALSGVVVALADEADVPRIRPIRELQETYLPATLLELARWIASYYGCSIGEAVQARIVQYAQGSPFVITSVVVGNVQYPEEVSAAVSRKLAATQELQRKDTEIEIEQKERTKREVQAQGIANAMRIIRGQLSSMYIQHEAIEAQKQMVNSPNHTVVYIPVGPMGVPITATMPAVPQTAEAAAR